MRCASKPSSCVRSNRLRAINERRAEWSELSPQCPLDAAALRFPKAEPLLLARSLPTEQQMASMRSS